MGCFAASCFVYGCGAFLCNGLGGRWCFVPANAGPANVINKSATVSNFFMRQIYHAECADGVGQITPYQDRNHRRSLARLQVPVRNPASGGPMMMMVVVMMMVHCGSERRAS